jgi:uncharacterized protein (UPF0548 family)
LRRPSEASLRELLEGVERAALTYSEVGATRELELPRGYRHDRYEAEIRDGAEAFDRAAAALLGWQAQVGAGLEVFPPGAHVQDGATVVLLIRAGLWIAAPCRVVYVVQETGRVGFAYGTLPGHPECGEATFMLSRDHGGRTLFTVRSFSRRVDLLARLGAPVARIVQRRVTHRYLEAIDRAANGGPPR